MKLIEITRANNIVGVHRSDVINGKMVEDFTGQTIEGNFFCNDARLTTLEGCPEIVTKNFNCADNPLTSLEFAPMIVKGDAVMSGLQLVTLKGIGTKFLKEIHGDLNIRGKHIPRFLSVVLNVKHLGGIDLIGKQDMFDRREVSTTEARLRQAQNIINNHLSGDRNLMDCHEELIQAGLKEYA